MEVVSPPKVVAITLGLFVLTMATSAVLAPPIDERGESAPVVVGSQGGGPGLHDHGSVYRLDNDGAVWREDSADSVFEVERLPNGSLLVAFADSGVTDCGPYETPCGRTGYRVVDPNGPEVLSEYSFPVRDIANSEVHAVEPLPEGSVAMVDMDRERLVVVENGSISWEWEAASVYEAPPDPTTVDWLHVNDVDHLGDGRFLVSVRNANQLLVVERGTGVVEVVNEDTTADDSSCTNRQQLGDVDGDGDVRCGDPAVLNHQHNPQWLGDGSVLVADSDNDRVVELHRTANGSWEPVWTLPGTGSIGFSWPRDADRLPNGNTLITDSTNKRIVEVDERGELVWSRSTDEVPYEADRIGVNDSGPLPTHEDVETVGGEESADLPVLSTLAFLLHTAVPAVPFWVGEFEVGVALVTLVVLAGAGVQWYRQREKPAESPDAE